MKVDKNYPLLVAELNKSTEQTICYENALHKTGDHIKFEVPYGREKIPFNQLKLSRLIGLTKHECVHRKRGFLGQSYFEKAQFNIQPPKSNFC